MKNDYYTPGVCNLNGPEVAYRMKAFYLGAGIAVPLLVALLVLKASPVIGIVEFLPIWIAAIGYLQARNKFCVGYAASGVYSASDEYADIAKVIEAEAKKLDQAKARKMNIQAALLGLLGAGVTGALLAII